MSTSKRMRSTSASSMTDKPVAKKARTEPVTKSSNSNDVTTSGLHMLDISADQSSAHTESPEPVHTKLIGDIPPAEATDTTPAAEASTKGRKPISQCFTEWNPASLSTLPSIQATWGIKPFPSDLAGPQPHPNSPSARTSNAATDPPLWEDRKFPFVSGRYHKSFGPGPAPTDPAAPDLDQEDNLVLQLIDMRPVRSGPNKGAPRRQPIKWHFLHGKPKDWTDVKQTLHAMNTRRRDNIRVITCDIPWTAYERKYLAQLCREFPNASITELAERHNYLFMNNFREGPLEDTMDVSLHQASAELSSGRTIESIRHEYLTWKHRYDAGEEPNPARDENHKKITENVQAHLDAFERDWDPAVDTAARGYPVDYVPPKTPSQKKAARAQQGKETRNRNTSPNASKASKRNEYTKDIPVKKSLSDKNISHDNNSDVPTAAPASRRRSGRLSLSSVSSLSEAPLSPSRVSSPYSHLIRTFGGSPHGLDDDIVEELLDLAGYNNPDEVRSSPPYMIPSSTPPASEPSSP